LKIKCKKCSQDVVLSEKTFKNSLVQTMARCKSCRCIFSVPKHVMDRINEINKSPKKQTWIHTPLKKKYPKVKKSHMQRVYEVSALLRREKYKTAHPFYSRMEWRLLRGQILCVHKECQKCGSEVDLQIDHIKPRWKYPHLALEKDNLQVLCEPCNMEKGHMDETDWRGHYRRVKNSFYE
jgi:5-methylcytosine-specific restriction endonuclease McrA